MGPTRKAGGNFLAERQGGIHPGRLGGPDFQFSLFAARIGGDARDVGVDGECLLERRADARFPRREFVPEATGAVAPRRQIRLAHVEARM